MSEARMKRPLWYWYRCVVCRVYFACKDATDYHVCVDCRPEFEKEPK